MPAYSDYQHTARPTRLQYSTNRIEVTIINENTLSVRYLEDRISGSEYNLSGVIGDALANGVGETAAGAW